MTRSDLSPSCIESHRSLIVTTPSISPGPTSAPDLSITAAEDGGIPKPGLRMGKDVGPPTLNRAIHANTVTTLDLPPQSLSLPSEADSDIAAVAGPSQRAEQMYLACGRENVAAVHTDDDKSLSTFESYVGTVPQGSETAATAALPPRDFLVTASSTPATP
ncbi:hypothetical protein EDB85DRAFT_1893190 [Lactarius pseudohatsudake]|nr:hypothetical protein EDB85DRAFT_1893190 [Lactarius pseudohatsudake]